MAKERGDTNKIRDEEREVETRAAFAGKGDDGGEGLYSMPGTSNDSAIEMCQSAADAAKSFNAGEEENAGGGTEAAEDYD